MIFKIGQGVLLSCSQKIREHLRAEESDYEDESSSDIEYPLTPPPSDDSESRSMSPAYDQEIVFLTMEMNSQHGSRRKRRHNGVLTRRRKRTQNFFFLSRRQSQFHKEVEFDVSPKPLTIHIMSRAAGRPLIASTACALARMEALKGLKNPWTEKFTL